MKNLVKKIKLSLTVVGAITILSSNILAQEIPSKGAIPFLAYDTNKNGFVSQSEFYDARAKRMSKKATQGKAMRNAGNAPDFNLFDTNNDGKLTKIELLEGQIAQMKNKRSNRGNMNNAQRGKQNKV